MEALLGAVDASRIQFALTVLFHFVFVPLSIGLGLIVAIFETKYYRSRKPEDKAASNLWIRIFTTTFVIGVASGITMEFSFGTNWANYSRFVGDIFGAPLAAEALFAFFLESTFLGILLFGRHKVSPKTYMVSSWVVFGGSLLSALWILIANSWMQTPAGAELSADGAKAVLTNFFEAAFNSSLLARYTHTIDALLIMGAFVAMAIGAYYLLKKRHTEFAMKTLRVGSVVALVTTCSMLVFAHMTAVGVAEEQPTKLAMMEGAYDSGSMPLYLIGYVDEDTQTVVAPIAIPGGTSFLASNSTDTSYPGMNELAASDKYGAFDVDSAPVNLVFANYHTMVACFGIIALIMLLALVFTRGKEKIRTMRWLQKLLVVSPLVPLIAIECGWVTAEVGRQPWVVYPAASGPNGVELLTDQAISFSVSTPELITTIVIFSVIYLLLLVAWARMVGGYIKKGPQLDPEDADGIRAGAASGGAATADAGALDGTAARGSEGSVA